VVALLFLFFFFIGSDMISVVQKALPPAIVFLGILMGIFSIDAV
jgi:hypothetical protein